MTDYKKVHMIGIGGIGMSALAQMLKAQGVEVSGSDREESPVSDMLERKGIRVLIGQRADNVPEDADVAVYSDAVPKDNPERVRVRELSIRECSYFAMLGELSKGKRTVAVAGTHGKTTTTGMLTKILVEAGARPSAIIGSIVKDFGSNYLEGSSNVFVVEACEYRNHVLELSPEVLVLTNVEWDHTDFFPSLAALQETFAEAIRRVPAHGVIVTDVSDSNIAPLLVRAKAKIIDYAGTELYDLLLPGEFNQRNARAAAAAARAVVPGLSGETIRNALESFHGTWRRFEFKGTTRKGAKLYDDYAHHPTAIRETLSALKALRPSGAGKVFVAFHPHLYSRTRDLFDAFAGAFGDADEVLLAPIYAARETDDGSISSEKLAAAIRARGTRARAATVGEITSILSTEPREGDFVMLMGAGDIYKIADPILGA